MEDRKTMLWRFYQLERTGDIVIHSFAPDERPGTCDVGIQVGEGTLHIDLPPTTTDDLIEGPVTLTKEDDQQQAQENPTLVK